MSPSVREFYNEHVEVEDRRLDGSKLEYAVTLHTINNVLSQLKEKESPTDKFSILDMGCGTGRYAIELARQGHHVYAGDVSSEMISKTRANTERAGVTLSALEVCNAYHLRENTALYKPRYYHISLLLGPLYHAPDDNERANVFQSTLAVTKPGGYIIAAFATRNAHLRTLAINKPSDLHTKREFYNKYLETGKGNQDTRASEFAPLMHDTPDSIKRFLVEQDRQMPYEVVKLVACEGFLGLHHAKYLTAIDDAAFQSWLNVVLLTADKEYNLGAADHIIAVLRKS